MRDVNIIVYETIFQSDLPWERKLSVAGHYAMASVQMSINRREAARVFRETGVRPINT